MALRSAVTVATIRQVVRTIKAAGMETTAAASLEGAITEAAAAADGEGTMAISRVGLIPLRQYLTTSFVRFFCTLRLFSDLSPILFIPEKHLNEGKRFQYSNCFYHREPVPLYHVIRSSAC